MRKNNTIKLKILVSFLVLVFTQGCSNLDVLDEDILKEMDSPNPIIQDEIVESSDSQDEEAIKVDQPIPIIWDDDGSPDGMIALMYFLQNPQVDVKAITVSCGEAYPHEFVLLLERLLLKLAKTDIPIGAGRELPLEGTNAFPTPWRKATSEFWGIQLPVIPNPSVPRDAAELMIDVLKTSPEPVTIFVSGTLTNLAQALRMEPRIKYKIRSVEIMGGALYNPGNIASDWHEATNETAEWNIYVDPVAAAEVFTSDIPINLTPLDATNQVVWIREDANSWQDSDTQETIMATQLLNWMLDEWFETGVYVWDLVAAVNLTHPELCMSEAYYVEVSIDKGPDEGRTVVVDGKPPNIIACLQPNSQAIREHVIDIFTNNN